jgi:acetolactate synthase-1/2/3 large subunit
LRTSLQNTASVVTSAHTSRIGRSTKIAPARTKNDREDVMARKSSGRNVDRRKFLTGVAVAGAASAVVPSLAAAATVQAPAAPRPPALPPTARVAAAETGIPNTVAKTNGVPGSDFMVDVIKSLDIDYITANPASSFRGLHESLINYGGNKKPEFITATHEEVGVAMAHGYFKVAGKPIATLCHGTVGLQHATMAIYNAWCDRVPVIVMGGNDTDASKRPPGVPTFHSAQDINAIVRDYTKWDDAPVSLQHFAQSFVRAYKLAMTPPYEPVMIALDAELQEETTHDRAKLTIPRYTPTAPPQGDANAVREAGRLLTTAERPVLVVDRAARTPNGIKLLVELAELLNLPVVDQRNRMNFPNTHYLNQTGRARQLIGQADLVMGLELSDFWNTVNAYIDNGEGLQEPGIKPGTKLVSIGTGDYYLKSNYQDFQRYQAVDISIAGDAEATLPALIEAVKSSLTADRKAAIAKLADPMKKAWKDARDRSLVAATYAWDAVPISTGRLCAELWAAVKDTDWSFTGGEYNVSFWPSRLWPMERYYHHLGGPGGYGLGYNLPAAVGAALANKATGRLTVNIQTDGDLLYAPGALWTAVHHKIPLLSVMHNNRAYHQEVMHVQRMSNRRDRVAALGNDFGPIGTRIENPNVDFAKLAQSMGMWATGPVTDPKDLAAALKRAVEVVKAGDPALIDVVTEPR